MALNIISNVQLDMKAPNTVIVYANQYDSAGSVRAQLLNSGESWAVPAGAKAVVMFKKSDNIGGFYDVTEFGIAAVEIDSDRSVIYINYDPQVLTTAGRVAVQINFYQNDQRLSSFAFYTDVQASAVTSGEIASSWLFNILSQEIAQTLTVATTPQAMTDWLEANISQLEGYVIDDTLTVHDAAADAQATGKMVTVSNLNPNTVANKIWVKKTPATLEIPTMEDVDDEVKSATSDLYVDIKKEYVPEYVIHDNMLINASTGAIESATNDSQKVMEFSVTDYSKFRMQASSYGGNSGAKYAFYSAESFALCGSDTLVGPVQTYNRTMNVFDYDIPSEAKWCCVYISSKSFISCVKVNKKVKGYTSIADDYVPTKLYDIGACVMHSGLMYMCIFDMSEPEEWNEAHWILTNVSEQILQITSDSNDISKFAKFQIGTLNPTSGQTTPTQNYAINTINPILFEKTTDTHVENGYDARVFYYDDNDNYTGVYRNIAQIVYHHNTIPAGSHVRFEIRISGSMAALTSLDIPQLSNKVTFKSEYAKQSDQVTQNTYDVSNGMAARMYAKGASPKSFERSIGILCAGQSNIAGVIPSSEIPSGITFPMENIKYSRSNTPTSFDNGISASANWGVDLALFDALNKLGNTVYGIKFAEVGTGIDLECGSTNRWTAYYEKLHDIANANLYKLETKVRKLAELNPNMYDIRALIWHQGENDSTFSNSGNVAIPNRYYENFKYVIAYIRGVVGNEKLPVIYGTISHNSIAYDPIIEAAQWRIAEEDPNVYCIDMSGATLRDEYHFNAAAAVYFGQKAFDALIDFGVVTGTKINPTTPWN